MNHCKESPETQTKALEAPQVAVMELLVVVLVEEAQQVAVMVLLVVVLVEEAQQLVATELHLHLLEAGAAMEGSAQPAVVTELPPVAADRQVMLAPTLPVNPPAADTELQAAVDPAEGHGEATEVDAAPVDRLDTPGATLSANLPAVATDLLAVEEDHGEAVEAEVEGRLDTPVPTPPASLLRLDMELQPLEVTAAVVECLLKVDTVLRLVATEPKLVIRGGGEGGEGTEVRGGGTEERTGGTGGRDGEEGMEGV